jgi:recombination protein RecT
MNETTQMTKPQQDVQQKPELARIQQLLESKKDALAQLLPKYLTIDRLLKVALNCIAKTPKLQQCSTASLFQCVTTAAELGLEPGSAIGEAYLVPYKETCTLIPGYRGLLKLIRNSGQLEDLRAVVVREKDHFRYREGLRQEIEHEPCLDGDPGPLKYVYAVAHLKGGLTHCEFMTKAQVDAIRGRSKSGNDGPWKTDYEEMARKTVVRRIAKMLPMSTEAEKAFEYDNEDYIDGEVTAQSDVVSAVSASAALKSKLAAKRPKILQIQDMTGAAPGVEASPEPEPVPLGEPPADVALPTP